MIKFYDEMMKSLYVCVYKKTLGFKLFYIPYISSFHHFIINPNKYSYLIQL